MPLSDANITPAQLDTRIKPETLVARPISDVANAIKTDALPIGVGLVQSYLIKSDTLDVATFRNVKGAEVKRFASVGNSPLGTPLSDTLILESQTVTMPDGTVQTLPQVQILDAVIKVNREKRMVIDIPVRGQDAIIEFTAMGYFAVSIDFSITQLGSPPLEVLSDLGRIGSAPVTIQVQSRFLQSLGINGIAFKNPEFAQVEAQPFKYLCSWQGYSDDGVDVLGVFQ